MEFWISFWTVLLILALAVFAGLAVAVTVGGFFDVKALFRNIEARHTQQDQQAEADSRQ